MMGVVDDFLKSGDAAWEIEKQQFNEAAPFIPDSDCYLVYNGSYYIFNRSKIFKGIKVVKAGNGTQAN
jgi:hypothetical protein